MEFPPERTYVGYGTAAAISTILEQVGYSPRTLICGCAALDRWITTIWEERAFVVEQDEKKLMQGIVGRYRLALIQRVPDGQMVRNQIHVLGFELDQNYKITNTSMSPTDDRPDYQPF